MSVTPGSATQLRALFGLRWQMVRSDGVRAAAILIAVGVGFLMLLVARGASAIDPVRAATAVELAPQAFLGFGVLALIAPLTAGGGNDVVPSSQLVAFPVRARTQFVGGLLLAPINLVWVLQILALIAETAFLTSGGNVLLGAMTTAVYVLAITALGQAMAWGIVGLRQSRRGRQAVALTGATLLLATVAIIRSGRGDELLDNAPTRPVVEAVQAGAAGDIVTWALTTGTLLLLAFACLRLGERTCGWALRRPGDAGSLRSTKVVKRRKPHASALRMLVAMDRASVWRAPALRRGAIVLAVLPGIGAAGMQVPWSSLIVLPGLVAAGAGLLFGINAFCLDGSGSVFLASLPHDPRLLARAKAIVITETVLASVFLAALAGSLRSPGTPTRAQVIAIVMSGFACSAVVVSRGMAASVRRPHKADLSGPRDAVAPPGALALASIRLALPAGLVGVVMELSTTGNIWWVPLGVACCVMALCALSLHRSLSVWADPIPRSRIVQTVSAG